MMTDEYEGALEKVVGDIAEFRQCFLDVFPEKTITDLKVAQHSNLESVSNSGVFAEDVIISSFTDCISISADLTGKTALEALGTIIIFAFGISFASIRMLQRNTLVRGGVALGQGSKLETGEILGDGIVRAYDIESNETIYPRVEIDADTLIFCSPEAAEACGVCGEQLDVFKHIWDFTCQFLSQDHDGTIFIDYSNPAFLDMISDDCDEREFYRAEYEKAEAALCKYMEEKIGIDTNRKVARKWQWLASRWKMHNSE